MKKSLIILLAALLAVSVIFAACSSKTEEETTTLADSTEADLDANDTEFGFEAEPVTDEDGKEVTDDKGNTVTTEVAVVYKKDSSGKTYAQKIDSDGNGVTNKKGKPVTVKTTAPKTTAKTDSQNANGNANGGNNSGNSADSNNNGGNNSGSGTGNSGNTGGSENQGTTTTTTTEKTTATTKKNIPITKDAYTTKFEGEKEIVPKTSDTGEEVNFDEKDQEIIASMLEVPYLYKASFEHSQGIPIETAVYTAVWMSQRDNATATGDNSPYDSNTVILNLFKYYGNTVVNFKTKCNGISDTPIKYKSSTNSFYISEFPEKQQTVKITQIEDMGNNNFYKITGTVKNADKVKHVVAIVQKNRLEPTLGFSIKALKWS